MALWFHYAVVQISDLVLQTVLLLPYIPFLELVNILAAVPSFLARFFHDMDFLFIT